MVTINYPTTAEKLSVKIIMTGILNMTGRIEYDDTDQQTIIWGPYTFNGAQDVIEAGHEYILQKNNTENSSLQNLRSTYILINLRNYSNSPVEAQAIVEFYQWPNGKKTLLEKYTLFDGTVAAKSEHQPDPSEIYLLKQL